MYVIMYKLYLCVYIYVHKAPRKMYKAMAIFLCPSPEDWKAAWTKGLLIWVCIKNVEPMNHSSLPLILNKSQKLWFSRG